MKTLMLCVGLGLAGCALVKDASDAVDRFCDGYMAAQPEVKDEALRRGVNTAVVAEAICILNDAGRAVWELFTIPGPEGKLMAAPEPQLEWAKNRALTVAKEQGELQ